MNGGGNEGEGKDTNGPSMEWKGRSLAINEGDGKGRRKGGGGGNGRRVRYPSKWRVSEEEEKKLGIVILSSVVHCLFLSGECKGNKT